MMIIAGGGRDVLCPMVLLYASLERVEPGVLVREVHQAAQQQAAAASSSSKNREVAGSSRRFEFAFRCHVITSHNLL